MLACLVLGHKIAPCMFRSVIATAVVVVHVFIEWWLTLWECVNNSLAGYTYLHQLCLVVTVMTGIAGFLADS